MKKHIMALFSGVGVSVLIGLGIYGVRNRTNIARGAREMAERGRVRGRRIAERGRQLAHRGQQFAPSARVPGIDLNTCSSEQLIALGMDNALAGRIIESRPYRSKVDLVSRIIVPTEVYNQIKNRISVSRPNDSVKIAS
jgi:hypothetical protein